MRYENHGYDGAQTGGSGIEPLAAMEALIGKSSLGAPDAVESRNQTPTWLVEQVAARCDTLANRGRRLAGSLHDRAVLHHADLRDADLRHARLRDADLRFADLTGADLTGAQLHGADLRFADLTGADLTGAQLDHVDLSNATLAGSILLDASLAHAFLNEANLDGAALTRATLDDAMLVGAVLCHATLYRSSLRSAVLCQTDLTGTYLSKGCLDEAIVMGSILQECELSEATFRRTHIGSVDLTSCLGLMPTQLSETQIGVDTVLPVGWSAFLGQSRFSQTSASAGPAQIEGRRHTTSGHDGEHDTSRRYEHRAAAPTASPPPTFPRRPTTGTGSRPPAHYTKGRHRAVRRIPVAQRMRSRRFLPVLTALVAIARIAGWELSPPSHETLPVVAENTTIEQGTFIA